jgi:hypothetical protein
MEHQLSAAQRSTIRKKIGFYKFTEIAREVGCSLSEVREYSKIWRQDPDYLAERKKLDEEAAVRSAQIAKEVREERAREDQRKRELFAKYADVGTAELTEQAKQLEQQIVELQQQVAQQIQPLRRRIGEMQEVLAHRKIYADLREHDTATNYLTWRIFNAVRGDVCHHLSDAKRLMEWHVDHSSVLDEDAATLHSEHDEYHRDSDCADCRAEAREALLEEVKEKLEKEGLKFHDERGLERGDWEYCFPEAHAKFRAELEERVRKHLEETL